MKNRILIFVIAFLILNKVDAEKLPGYFITNNHDTVRVTFKVPIELLKQEPNYERFQGEIKYFDSNNQKKLLTPNMAIEFTFEYYGKKIRMISIDDSTAFESPCFLHLIKDGKLKLFEFYFSNEIGGGMVMGAGGRMTMAPVGSYGPTCDYYLQKGNTNLYEINSGLGYSFKDDMQAYFSDCPELAKKIREKIYKSRDIELIVDEYNKNCK